MLKHGTTPITDLRTHGGEIDLLINGGQIVWARIPATPGMPSLLGTRITEDDTGNGPEKWFECGFPIRDIDDMVGNASAGWTTLHGFFRLVLWWSENLADWSVGKFISVGTTLETLDGIDCTVYWARSIYPVDSMIKTGQLMAANSGNTRNNPIISVVINGEIQDLQHYPYDMASGTARALLQADLRASGWTGATVTATSVLDWKIILYGVNLSDYGVNSYAAWPLWYTYDPMGNPVTVSSQHFTGEFLNSVGIRTAVPKQFARLGVTSLKL